MRMVLRSFSLAYHLAAVVLPLPASATIRAISFSAWAIEMAFTIRRRSSVSTTGTVFLECACSSRASHLTMASSSLVTSPA